MESVLPTHQQPTGASSAVQAGRTSSIPGVWLEESTQQQPDVNPFARSEKFGFHIYLISHRTGDPFQSYEIRPWVQAFAPPTIGMKTFTFSKNVKSF